MFYKIDSRRITLREYWWGTPNPILIFLAWVIKLLRIRLPASADDPNVESLEPFRVTPDQLPEEARTKFHSVHEELQALGFHSPVCYWIHDVKHQTDICQVVYLHNSGQSVAKVHYRAWHMTKPAKEFFFPLFLTRFTDGTYLISSAGKRDLFAPAECREKHQVGATATKLWTLHQTAIQEELLYRTVTPIRDEYELVDAVENHHGLVRDFHIDRGVFVPMSEEEERSVAEAAEAATEAVAEGETPSQTSAILDEIEKLQTKRSGWGAAVILLIVSVGLFFALGAAIWPWEFVAMLLPILFFHELGHYTAMRLFRYSNVKMFFIPFLGAAVSGRHYNVPGWKKVIVSLAGPLPGILVGAVLGACAVYFQITWLHHAAIITIILNGFNLLPILPLDGGWVMHALLFSRHYILDAGFRLLTVVLLLAGSHFFDDRFLFFFGLVMAAGLPVAFRMAGVVSAIRRQGVSTASPDSQTIAPETAEAIAEEIRERFPQGLTNKHVAQFTLQAFEALNARPPGILATIFLGGVYFGSFLFALVALGLLTVAMPMFAHPDPTPTHPIRVDQIEVTGHERSGDVSHDEATIVTTFSEARRATTRFSELKGRLPEDATFVRFGESLLLTIPSGKQVEIDEWEAQLAIQASETFNSLICFQIGFSVAATAPSEEVATQIKNEMETYQVCSTWVALNPAWHPEHPPTEKQRQARKLFVRWRATEDVYDDPRYVQLNKRHSDAAYGEDEEGRKEIWEELQTLRKEIQEERFEKLLEDTSGPGDRELLKLFRRRPIPDFDLAEWGNLEDPAESEEGTGEPSAPDEAADSDPAREARRKAIEENQRQFSAWQAELAEVLGGELRNPGRVAEAERFRIDGVCEVNGRTVQLLYGELYCPVDAAPAFVRWLDGLGCTEIKYSFFGD